MWDNNLNIPKAFQINASYNPIIQALAKDNLRQGECKWSTKDNLRQGECKWSTKYALLSAL